MLEKIWSFIEKHRFTVIAPLICLGLWLVAHGCMPLTIGPLSQKQVSAVELEQEFAVWQKQQEIVMQQFDFARADIERQKEQWSKFQGLLLTLASGTVADWPGLVQLLLSGGFLGMGLDVIRKNAVLAGVKYQQKNS